MTMSVSQPGVLASGAGERLRRSFRGELVVPGADGYERHRHVWNGTIDRSPALIARCLSTEDVVAAVEFAREESQLLAVRGGGHSFAGFSTCDGGVVVDLSPMAGVSVDPGARVARVEGGATWGAFDAAAHAHGLATTGGLISTTGVAGLTLGGGIGWLMRKHGLACDNLLGVEMVTANGEFVRARADENAELFWAVRGGGGNFGIITSFEFLLYPVTTVVGGLMLFPGSRTPEVLRFYADYVRDLPDDFTTMLSAITAPQADFVPEHMWGQPAMAVAGCHSGDPDEAERTIEPLRDLGPAVDLVEPISYPELQSMLDEDVPYGIRCYLKAGYLPALTDSVIDVIADHTRPMSSPASTFDFHHMGGAVARVDDTATAFGDRRSAFCFNVVGLWNDPDQDDTHIAWAREFASALEPFGTGGVYVNFTSEVDRAHAAYSDAKFERLRALKRTYDPTNLFRLNQNIQP
jgi:FAD/FMN-containing dehydrogenase